MSHLLLDIIRWTLWGLAVWTFAGIAVAGWLFAAHRHLRDDVAPQRGLVFRAVNLEPPAAFDDCA